MRIAILDDYQNAALGCADWGRLDAEVEVFSEHVVDPDELVHVLAGFDVVVAMRERTRFPAAVLGRLTDLKLLVTTGMRNAAIDLAAAGRHGVVVCGTGALTHQTVELTWALILAAARHLPAEDRSLRAGRWQQTVGTDLHGRTLGLVGLGRLGASVARIGQAFSMDVIAWSQNLTAERAAEHGVTAVTKELLLGTADVVSVHLVLSDRTRGLIGAGELALMKPTAILVNTSRGPIVKLDDLVAALREGRLRAAALDVLESEPPDPAALEGVPGLLLTPHTAFYSESSVRESQTKATTQVIRVLTGGQPDYQVN